MKVRKRSGGGVMEVLDYKPGPWVPLQRVPTLCLSPLLTTPFIPMAILLVKVCALMASHQATPGTLHLGCSYHLNPSHCFLSTWCAVRLEKKKKNI